MALRRRVPLSWLRVGALALLLAAVALVLGANLGGNDVNRYVDDIASPVVAFFALGAALWRRRRSGGALRRSWTAMSAALAATLSGEITWAVIELVQDREVPSPGLTDVFYLAFYPFALAALLYRPCARIGSRTRTALEGALVASSVLAVSSATVLGPLRREGGLSSGALATALAYPLSDVLLVSVMALIAVRQPLRGGGMFLAAGLLTWALGDSTFTALGASGVYDSGSLADVAYLAGYVLVAEAAIRDRPTRFRLPEARRRRLVSSAPLVPALGAVGIGAWLMFTPAHDVVGAFAVVAVVVVLLLRQLLSNRENQNLLAEILAQQNQLQHLAFHDPLTGLANRSLFNDRLAHAVELHQRDLTPIAVLLLDLDNFKAVNDTLGHLVGDELLVTVAHRLNARTRSADTVSRLGGDEFALLVEGHPNPAALAERLLADLRYPIVLGARSLSVTASIGIAAIGPDDRPVESAELLARADVAMYNAKRAGKSTALPYTEREDVLVPPLGAGIG